MFLSNWPIKTLSLTSEEGFFVDKIKVFFSKYMYGSTSICARHFGKCVITSPMNPNLNESLSSWIHYPGLLSCRLYLKIYIYIVSFIVLFVVLYVATHFPITFNTGTLSTPTSSILWFVGWMWKFSHCVRWWPAPILFLFVC